MKAKIGTSALVLLRQLAAESYKFATDRASISIAMITVGLPTLAAAIYSWSNPDISSPRPNLQTYESLAASAVAVAIALGMLSIRGFTQEFQSGFVDISRISANRRFQRSFAKFTVGALAAWSICTGGYSAGYVFFVWQQTGELVVLETNAASYVALRVGAAMVLFSILGGLVATFSKTLTQTFLIYAAITIVAPTVLAAFAPIGSLHLSSLTPIACVQALATRAGATPFTMMGIPPSDLTPFESLQILVGWCISIACLNLVRAVFTRKKPRIILRELRRTRGPFQVEYPQATKTRSPFLLAVQSALFAQFSSKIFWWLALGTAVLAAYTSWFSATILLTEFISRIESSVAYADRIGQSLAAPVQAESIIIAVLGTQIGARWFSDREISTQFLAIPRRVRWSIAQFCASGIAFAVAAALAATCAMGAAWFVAMTFEGLPVEFTSQAGWYFIHSVLAIGACGLIGLAIGFLAQGNALGTISTLSIFVIFPSLLVSLSQPSLVSGNVILGNLWVAFPFASAAVRWTSEQIYLPPVLASGQVQLNADQELLLLYLWLGILAALALRRIYRLASIR